MPANLRLIKTTERVKKEAIIPIAEAKKLNLAVLFPAPPWLRMLKILIDKTGSTQGIKFRISPPRIAIKIMFKRDRLALIVKGMA